jgi:FkbM family methyltransferase
VGANSLARRVLKRTIYPLVGESAYQAVQAAAKAWDIRSGSWSEPELNLIPFAVRAGETVLDIGANFGVYAYHLSRAVGRAGRVYAFEPVPFTFRTLEKVGRLLRFRNVELVPKGCSERSGPVAFRIPLQRSRAMSAGQAHLARRNDDRAGKETQVRWAETREVWSEVVALDEFLPRLSELSFIKCDIEGAELFAFRGAQKTIEAHCPSVVCEINPWFLEGFGLEVRDLTAFFFAREYALYRYEVAGGRGMLRPCAEADVVEDNYVFLHPRRRDRFASLLTRS